VNQNIRCEYKAIICLLSSGGSFEKHYSSKPKTEISFSSDKTSSLSYDSNSDSDSWNKPEVLKKLKSKDSTGLYGCP
jgi:hypothetical protein